MRPTVLALLVVAVSSLLSAATAAGGACVGAIGGKVGQCAPEFSLPSLAGKSISLSSYRGKVVFLNFWATWCAPCAEEMPAMERANGRVASKDFAMLTVSIDSEGKPAIEKFLKRVFGARSPEFPILLDSQQRVSKSYGTFKVPETYIIDKNGRVLDRVEGVREWDDSLIVHYLELLKKQ